MGNWTWKCVVCEKDMVIYNEGDDDRASLPCVDGGFINIGFGFGSRFDGLGDPAQHQGCICDDCYETKRHLMRSVEVDTRRSWKVLPKDYREESQ